MSHTITTRAAALFAALALAAAALLTGANLTSTDQAGASWHKKPKPTSQAGASWHIILPR